MLTLWASFMCLALLLLFTFIGSMAHNKVDKLTIILLVLIGVPFATVTNLLFFT